MLNITLVKKTQKKWKCYYDLCPNIINPNQMMIRETHNKWQQNVYCLKCGKSLIEDKLKELKENLGMMENDDTYYIDFIVEDYKKVIKKMEEWLVLISNYSE